MATSDYRAGYRAGYQVAYAEIYSAIDSADHPRRGGDCRACGVVRSVSEGAMLNLARKLSRAEFDTLARVNAKYGPGP